MHLCGSQRLRLLVIDIDIVPLSIYFNRHLTKLDELNDLFFGHAAQEDGIVLSEVKTSRLIEIQLRFLCQGLGLNEQELEMRSILVRVQQVFKITFLPN